MQPCRFVVLTDLAHKEELAACGQFSSWIPQAPVNIAIVVPEDGRDFDAGRTAQNIMIACNALGLASCPVTMHDKDCARSVLALPDGHRVVIVIALANVLGRTHCMTVVGVVNVNSSVYVIQPDLHSAAA